jgi:hypothetical protein
VKKEKHLEKAMRIEKTIRTLDPEFEWELIVEGVQDRPLSSLFSVGLAKAAMQG